MFRSLWRNFLNPESKRHSCSTVALICSIHAVVEAARSVGDTLARWNEYFGVTRLGETRLHLDSESRNLPKNAERFSAWLCETL